MPRKISLSGVGIILGSMFVVWWVLFVMAYVTDSDTLWFLVKWSPCVLIPWGVIDVWRHRKR
ncbi:hypothetical protein SEA_IBANTIK_87 [Streptomyces phage Ibantik]|uniref:Uncharacterized protein n=1 Tax=Streptomyces phage Ibantik TaxID=2182397 RepID=A0A2U8UNJ3_9CAUD|nr:hypothetical protein QEH36_gp078 [Streptomyces phage Ibantik]AWN05309.1 hypothetical protein SEA_IBANTIK_87 [Streptomyces phage Ibantik]